MTEKKKRTTLDVWKSIRKGPVPPGKVHKVKDRDLRDEEDAREMEQWRGWRGEDFEEWEDEE